MASKERKSPYDDTLLEDARSLTEDLDLTMEEDFSLEEILAEYGVGRRDKLLSDVERAAARELGEEIPAEEAPTEEEPEEIPEEAVVQPVQPERQTEEPPASEKKAGKAAPKPERREQELPPQPRPIPMEEIVRSTVDSVLEEQELLPEKPRRRGLFSRRRIEETEELYSRPEEPEEEAEEEPEPIGPERPLEEMAAGSRRELQLRSRPMLPALLLTLVLGALSGLEEYGITIPVWSSEPLVRTGVMAGILLLELILCRSVVGRAFRLLRRKHCSGELLITLSAFATLLDCVSSLLLSGRSAAEPYALTACAALCIAQWGGIRESRAWNDTYRTASLSDQPPYLVTETPEGACKQLGAAEGFYTAAVQDDLPRRWQTAILPVILMGTVVFAGLSSVGRSRPQDFLLCWSAILTASAAFSLPLGWSLPFSYLAKQLQKSGCAVAGWHGAEQISRQKAIILTDGDLFPPGAIRLNGIKVFGEELPHAVSYAASMVRASGSGLCRLFDELVRSEGGQYYEPDDFSFYEEGGFSAAIRGESVLLGTASFLRKMEVRLPSGMNLKTGIFLAVDRQLSAVFAVKYSAPENVDWALRMLQRSRVTPILASRDPNITPALLKRKFNKNVKVQYPALAARLALSEQEDGRGRPRALLLREGLLPYAETVSGSRRLCSAARRCTVLALLSSAVGALLSYYLCMTESFALMTPVTMLLFLLLWLLPVLILSLRAGRG